MGSVSAKVVLYIVNDLVYFRAHRQALASAIADLGCRVFVIAGNCTQQDAREADPYTLVAFDIVRQYFSPADDFNLARFTRRWVKNNRPDIVHMITIKPVLFGTLGLVLPSFSENLRVVWTLPGLGKIYEPGTSLTHRLRRWLTTKGLTLAARRGRVQITVENAFDRDRLIEQNIAEGENLHVIDGTGLDLDCFSPATSRNEGALTFLLATRLLKAKGIGAYIAAARRMAAEGVTARFLLAGLTDADNPDAYDEQLIEEAAKDGVIEWLGPIEQASMPALLRQTDVFCLPTSLQEGLPRSLMEAAACGCALVAPNQVPIRKFLIDGETGWLIDHVGEEELVTAFRTAIEQPEKTRDMSKYAASHIRSLPVSDAEIFDKFLWLYGQGRVGL